jgi:hypothetical protein
MRDSRGFLGHKRSEFVGSLTVLLIASWGAAFLNGTPQVARSALIGYLTDGRQALTYAR